MQLSHDHQDAAHDSNRGRMREDHDRDLVIIDDAHRYGFSSTFVSTNDIRDGVQADFDRFATL